MACGAQEDSQCSYQVIVFLAFVTVGSGVERWHAVRALLVTARRTLDSTLADEDSKGSDDTEDAPATAEAAAARAGLAGRPRA